MVFQCQLLKCYPNHVMMLLDGLYNVSTWDPPIGTLMCSFPGFLPFWASFEGITLSGAFLGHTPFWILSHSIVSSDAQFYS